MPPSLTVKSMSSTSSIDGRVCPALLDFQTMALAGSNPVPPCSTARTLAVWPLER